MKKSFFRHVVIRDIYFIDFAVYFSKSLGQPLFAYLIDTVILLASWSKIIHIAYCINV